VHTIPARTASVPIITAMENWSAIMPPPILASGHNCVPLHKTLPAMAAGVTDRLWEIGDIGGVLEAFENRTSPVSS
jgi:hypothetical protein